MSVLLDKKKLEDFQIRVQCSYDKTSITSIQSPKDYEGFLVVLGHIVRHY